MTIKGNLETFYLTSLLQMLNYDRKTGKLTIKCDVNEVQIFLHEGDIVFATETQKTNRLGDLLKNNGIISQQILNECLALSRKNKQSLGKTLVQQGYISLENLNAFLLKQAENTIYNVFLWTEGEFEYRDQGLNLKGVVGNKLNTMNLLLEASRRIDEIEIFKKQIPDEGGILRMAGNTDQDEGDIKLNPDEWRTLSLIDGRSTVRQIIDKSGFDDFTAYKHLNSLIASGRVEVSQPKSETELAKEAVSQLSGTDSRQFREALDSLGLKRSSILRVALTRIFRDAVDEEQVSEAVKQEAGKVSDPEERATLKKLADDNPVPFIQEMIELLQHAVNKK
jgi:DNA-binding MarR family transcriptional regulator